MVWKDQRPCICEIWLGMRVGRVVSREVWGVAREIVWQGFVEEQVGVRADEMGRRW
jgi:hypothetical protein